MSEATLWGWFSKYIRLRESDDNGYVKCFTCPKIDFYKKMDCGHGHGCQHKGTKYNEKNNQPQCTNCNSFNEGRKDIYKANVDKKYGPGTWDMLEILSRVRAPKLGDVEIKALSTYYRNKVKQLLKQKGLV
jgi:hypothetical protein